MDGPARLECAELSAGCPVKVIAVSGDRRREYLFFLKERGVYSTIVGPLRAEELVEAGYGGVVEAARGTAYVVRPTWVEVLEHKGRRRTQVIYPKDSAYMVLRAGLRVGSRVFEAGFGSGFLSTVILSVICPGGELHVFELRSEFAESAAWNVGLVGLGDCLRMRLGDVLEGLPEYPSGFFDAGFLDLPDPWRVLGEASRVLKPGSPLLVFLPTSSQVDKLLSQSGRFFAVDRVEEVLLRPWEPNPGALRPSPRMIGHTGFILVLRALHKRDNRGREG